MRDYEQPVARFERPRQKLPSPLRAAKKTLPVALYLFDVYFSVSLAVCPWWFYHVGQLVVDTFRR